jgi:hypothetical protein
MSCKRTKIQARWAMMAALMALLFSPLSASACRPAQNVLQCASAVSHDASREEKSGGASHCHQDAASQHETSHSEYSYDERSQGAPENAPQCCCAHDKNPLQLAAVFTQHGANLEYDRVATPFQFAPPAETHQPQIASANSPPLVTTSSSLASRAPPFRSE